MSKRTIRVCVRESETEGGREGGREWGREGGETETLYSVLTRVWLRMLEQENDSLAMRARFVGDMGSMKVHEVESRILKAVETNAVFDQVEV